MGYAGIIITAISAAYGAYAQKEAGDFQAAIAKRNADTAERAARDAELRGLEEGTKVALIGGATRGAIRAGYGASGIETSTGSPLDILSDAAMFTELDKETARSNARRESYALRTQAGNFLAQGSAAQAEGNNAAVGTILSGIGSVAGDYYAKAGYTTKAKVKKPVTIASYSLGEYNL